MSRDRFSYEHPRKGSNPGSKVSHVVFRLNGHSGSGVRVSGTVSGSQDSGMLSGTDGFKFGVGIGRYQVGTEWYPVGIEWY